MSHRILTVLALALVHSACDSSATPLLTASPLSTPSSGGTHAPTEATPSELGHPPTTEELRRGRQVFGAACGRCHSPAGGAPSVVGLRLTPQRLMAVLHAGDDEGRRLMPAINPGDMTDADLPVLVAWLRSENVVQ